MAVGTDDRRLGVVARVDHGPAQDLLVVRPATGDEVLVPFVAALVPVVDVPGGRVVIDPPGGLFADPDLQDPAPGRRARGQLMRIDIVTIFPDYLAPLSLSLIGKAREQGLLDVAVHDLRDFAHDRHRTVDDTPYGGGAGLVMRPEPWGEALDAVLSTEPVGSVGPTASRRTAQRDRCSWSRLRPASG